MTTSSRNAGVRKLIEADGEEATKEYVKKHYGIPDNVNDWKTIDMMAEKKADEQWRIRFRT